MGLVGSRRVVVCVGEVRGVCQRAPRAGPSPATTHDISHVVGGAFAVLFASVISAEDQLREAQEVCPSPGVDVGCDPWPNDGGRLGRSGGSCPSATVLSCSLLQSWGVARLGSEAWKDEMREAEWPGEEGVEEWVSRGGGWECVTTWD